MPVAFRSPLRDLMLAAALLSSCSIIAAGCAGARGAAAVGLKPPIVEVRGLSLEPGAIGGPQPTAEVILELGIENPNNEPIRVKQVYLKLDTSTTGIILEKQVKYMDAPIDPETHAVIRARYPGRYLRGSVPVGLPPFTIRGNVTFESAKGQFLQGFTQTGAAVD